MQELSEAFREVIERYPPEYRSLREQLVATGAKPPEQAWHELHLEMLSLEILGRCNWMTDRQGKAVSKALQEALAEAQDNWSQVYQQLVNVADERNAAHLRDQVKSARLFPPLDLKGERPELEKLGNLILSRLAGARKALKEGEEVRAVVARSVARGLSALPAGYVDTAMATGTFAEMAARLTRNFEQEKATFIRRPSLGKPVAALLLLFALAGGGYHWATRPVAGGGELLEAARASYQSGDFGSAANSASKAVDRLKEEGAEAGEIHKAREFLSTAYYKDGQLFHAQQQLEILIKAYPDNKSYRATLEQIKLERKDRSG